MSWEDNNELYRKIWMEINPFIKNGKDVLVETNEYKEVKFRLNYLLQTKGFGVLTGGHGQHLQK